MEKKYFGTDGIRGEAGTFPMTPEVALKVGVAVGKYFGTGSDSRFLIGKDTRLSGYVFEYAIASGIAATGGEVFLTGPITTPGIAYLTRKHGFSAGIVISASHNPFFDNGIKIFDSKGNKLEDEVELKIESLMDQEDLFSNLKTREKIGKIHRYDEGVFEYIEFLTNAFSIKREEAQKFKVVLDCANGAAYKIAPAVFEKLGFNVSLIGCEPDGTNINKECGATDIKALSETVQKIKADIGIAYDGDGDRVILVDEKGEVLDGDRIIAFFVDELHNKGRLKNRVVVTTTMSNIGLEKFLNKRGISLIRADVGDKYVAKGILEYDAVIGGEQSGHIILQEYTTTGDGILTSLFFLKCVIDKGIKVSEAGNEFVKFPQKLVNIKVKNKRKLEDIPGFKEIYERFEREIGKNGRVVIRYSGTEMKLRIMVEASQDEIVDEWIFKFKDFFQKNLST